MVDAYTSSKKLFITNSSAIPKVHDLPMLKCLDLFECKDMVIDTTDYSLDEISFEECSNITIISLNNRIKTLKIVSTSLTSYDFIRELVDLEHLTIDKCPNITEDCIQNLKELSKLKTLHVDCRGIFLGSSISSLVDLEELSICAAIITPIERLYFPRLSSIRLTRCVTSNNLNNLPLMKHVKTMCLNGHENKAVVMDKLCIEELIIDDTSLEQIGRYDRYLKLCSTIKKLSFIFCDVMIDNMSDNIMNLAIIHTNFAYDYSPLTKLSHLKSLKLKGRIFLDSYFTQDIKHLTCLEHLDISGCSICSAVMNDRGLFIKDDMLSMGIFTSLTRLTSLDVSNVRVKDMELIQGMNARVTV